MNYRSPTTLRDEQQSNIEAFFHQRHDEHRSEYPDWIEFLERCLLFITIGSGTRSAGVNAGHRCRATLNDFGKLHFWLSTQALGNNLHRKRRHQPLAFAYVDFEGSRSPGMLNVASREHPHVHALMLVRPQHVDLVADALLQLPTHLRRMNVRADRFSIEEGGLERLASYANKGFTRSPSDHKDHDFLSEFFPKWTPGVAKTRIRGLGKRNPVACDTTENRAASI